MKNLRYAFNHDSLTEGKTSKTDKILMHLKWSVSVDVLKRT
jgi:hypothetical protein